MIILGNKCICYIKKYHVVIKKDRKSQRKILGPQKRIWKNIKNNDLYKNTEMITVTMRKRRLKFYGNGENGREPIEEDWTGLKATPKWVEVVKRDAVSNEFTSDFVQNRKEFRSRINNIKIYEEKPENVGPNC